MDVDLLRPGTVPISQDTRLWFEFLLNPKLLEEHLSNPNGDPTPTELINRFLTMSATEHKSGVDMEFVNESKSKISLRGQGLKVLALKVAAYLKWDLDVLESKLPLGLQIMLLKDFLTLVSDEFSDPNSHGKIDFTVLPPQVFFSVLLYHRWVIRSYVKSISSRTQLKLSPSVDEGTVPCAEVAAPSEPESKVSADLLLKVAATETLPALLVPTFESFVPLIEDITDVQQRWDVGEFVSPAQYRCQILMEVGEYCTYRECYAGARKVLAGCRLEFARGGAASPDKSSFSKVTADRLSGLCTALGVPTPTPVPSPPLSILFLKAIATLEVGQLLEKDNQVKEVPMLYRDCLELEVMSEVASGRVTAHRDGVAAIQATNLVRRALAGTPLHLTTKANTVKLNKALLGVLDSANPQERARLRRFLLEQLSSQDVAYVRELTDMPAVRALLTTNEIQSVQNNDYADSVPSVLLDPEASPTPKNASCVLPALERQIISSYDPHEIKNAVGKLYQAEPSLPIEKISRNWEIPIPLQNVIMSLPNGMVQNYIYVLLCKAYELDQMKSFTLARTMLRMVTEEMSVEFSSQSLTKLTQLINWELLLIDIHQFHAEWPAKHMDWPGLGKKCSQLLEVGQADEGLLPRVSLREDCCLTLLNMGRWTDLASAPPRLLPHSSQLYLSIANVCLDIKLNRKPNNELWDKVLAVVMNKRQGDGPIQMQEALVRIVDVTSLTVIASLLSRIHNILSQQPLSDIFLHLLQLWPTTIKNSSLYNVKWVSEMLWDLVNHAVKFYPHNMMWCKLLGDLQFAGGHYAKAIKCYLEAAIAGSDYFSRSVNRSVLEDHYVRKMIKACIQLQCHNQAAVLCQFLEEVDYTTAFKSLQEPSSWDAMDSYYDCIWDVTILEFLINLHSRRNEHYRKKRAIQMMGLLELNSNNNEEIKREAENIRKTKFLRAMAKQYIC